MRILVRPFACVGPSCVCAASCVFLVFTGVFWEFRGSLLEDFPGICLGKQKLDRNLLDIFSIQYCRKSVAV